MKREKHQPKTTQTTTKSSQPLDPNKLKKIIASGAVPAPLFGVAKYNVGAPKQ